MMLLSRLAAPLARFRPDGIAPLRRIPFPALALAVCLLFAAVGVAVLDDYGASPDARSQRRIAIVNADYITGDRDALTVGLPSKVEYFYGVVFELPLLLAERALGWPDSRRIYLSRHLITHLFFIAGGFCCGLLAWRMFGRRRLALLALLLFLLHPRIYAHSFFNSKDIPFLVMFIIALYLLHRAFRRDTLGAFVLLGLVVGLAVNLRPFALLFIPAVLAMRGLDWRFAGDAARRKRVLYTCGIFALAALASIYASHPYYWENPLRFWEGLQALSQHPILVDNMFRGQIVRSDAVPPEYIPVWFGITAPAAALLLGAAGIAAILWRGWRAPGRILRDGELRFRWLLLVCFALPIAAAIILQSNIYNGWRQLYFLWAPFCLLAMVGLHWGAARGGRRSPAAGYGAAAAGLVAAVYGIISLHPQQQIYFNLPTNLAAQGELGQMYSMDYWGVSRRQGLEYLLARQPDSTVYILYSAGILRNAAIMPGLERIAVSDGWAADYHIGTRRNMRARAMASGPAVYSRRAYGGDYLAVVAPRLVWGAGLRPGEDDYRAAYRRVTAAARPAARSDFDVYIHDGALYYVKENCRPEDVAPRVFLHLFPVNSGDLPAYRREYGFDNRSFDFGWRGGFFDGKCITQEPLPDYPIARIRTGQHIPGSGELWRADFPVGQ